MKKEEPLSKTPMEHQRVVVIGLGGIGSQLLPSLLHYLVSRKFAGEIVLMDGDLYEEKNLNRQLVPDMGIGMNKAEALAVSFKHLPVTISALPYYLDEINVELVIKENDLIVCGVDNHYTRRLIDERVQAMKNVSYISGGNDLTDGNSQVVRRRGGKSIDPPLCAVHPEIAAALEPPDFTPGCDAMVNAAPQIIVTNLMVASTMLNEMWAIMEDQELPYSEVYIDVIVNAARSKQRTVSK